MVDFQTCTDGISFAGILESSCPGSARSSSSSVIVFCTRAVHSIFTVKQPSAVACFLLQGPSSGIPCMSTTNRHHLSQLSAYFSSFIKDLTAVCLLLKFVDDTFLNNSKV